MLLPHVVTFGMPVCLSAWNNSRTGKWMSIKFLHHRISLDFVGDLQFVEIRKFLVFSFRNFYRCGGK
jgi:hypothetical protein